jgi:hypothetical protein
MTLRRRTRCPHSDTTDHADRSPRRALPNPTTEASTTETSRRLSPQIRKSRTHRGGSRCSVISVTHNRFGCVRVNMRSTRSVAVGVSWRGRLGTQRRRWHVTGLRRALQFDVELLCHGSSYGGEAFRRGRSWFRGRAQLPRHSVRTKLAAVLDRAQVFSQDSAHDLKQPGFPEA